MGRHEWGSMGAWTSVLGRVSTCGSGKGEGEGVGDDALDDAGEGVGEGVVPRMPPGTSSIAVRCKDAMWDVSALCLCQICRSTES